jgi:phosphoglycerate-specific signal transduction histidine kinase
MAFAKQNGNAHSFVTEKDLLRQISSNYTKNQLLRENESKLDSEKAADAKSIMTSNLAKVIRVWSAFTKFIKSQVLDKNKNVDTQSIGLFLSSKG